MPLDKTERSRAGDVSKAIAKGSLFIFIGTTTGTAIMALASILIARFLRPSSMGGITSPS